MQPSGHASRAGCVLPFAAKALRSTPGVILPSAQHLYGAAAGI